MPRFPRQEPAHLYDVQLQIEANTGSLNTKGPMDVTNTLYVRLKGWGGRERVGG